MSYGMFCRKQKGQMLLIVVLVVIVASTIGLSLASRSITNLRTSTEEVDSQKALAAAEAGIERAIQGSVLPTGVAIQGGNPGNSSYTTKIDQVFGGSLLMNGGNSVPKDEGADLWLSNYSSDPALNFGSPWSGALNIYWGTDSSTACNNPALEIIIVSGSKNDPISKRYAYDPCQTRGNNFSAPALSSGETIGTSPNSKTFFYSATISGIYSGLIARIIPIYGNANVGIKVGVGDPPLPLQGYIISSTGTSGQADRKLTVFKGYPQTYLPYLSYGLFVAN